MSESVPLNQEGFKFSVVATQITGAVRDVSGAGVKQIKYRKPGASAWTAKTASFETDGTDGDIYYATVAGELDTQGWWEYRGYFEIGSFKGHTGIERVLVGE